MPTKPNYHHILDNIYIDEKTCIWYIKICDKYFRVYDKSEDDVMCECCNDMVIEPYRDGYLIFSHGNEAYDHWLAYVIFRKRTDDVLMECVSELCTDFATAGTIPSEITSEMRDMVEKEIQWNY